MSNRFATSRVRPIKIFTPSFADDSNTNAQNLTVKEVVARLSPERFHVTMFCLNEPDSRITQRPNTRLWRWHHRGNTLCTLLRLATDVPDVYFFPREGPLDERFFQVRRALHWHTAVVTYMVSGGLAQAVLPPGQLRNLRNATAVYANCRYLTGVLKERLGVLAEAIYDGVDRRYFYSSESRDGSGQNRLTVLYAGSFRPYKRVDQVVKQAAQWPEVDFRLCGEGEEKERCQRLAAELRCRNVRFLGHLSQSEVGEQMRRADVFLFPSELEGHPQVLLQAAGCGLPCIAMNSYRPDAVVDGATGFLVSDEKEMGDKLGLLLTDTVLRAEMSKAAVKHATQFDWDKVTADWAAVFEKVAGKKG